MTRPIYIEEPGPYLPNPPTHPLGKRHVVVQVVYINFNVSGCQVGNLIITKRNLPNLAKIPKTRNRTRIRHRRKPLDKAVLVTEPISACLTGYLRDLFSRDEHTDHGKDDQKSHTPDRLCCIIGQPSKMGISS